MISPAYRIIQSSPHNLVRIMKSQFFIVLLASIFSTTLSSSPAAASLCGGSEWLQYEQDRCFRLLDIYVNQSSAEEACNGLDTSAVPTLASIRKPEEMAFLLSMLPDDVMNNIWIGAKRKEGNASNDFIWTKDDSPVVYANWLPGRPVAEDRADCVQMESGYSKVFSQEGSSFQDKGKWDNVICSIRNLVLCQKEPNIPLDELQRIVLELRETVKDLNKTVEDLDKTVEDLDKTVEDLKKNPVPLGYIYTQLPGNPPPSQTWPQVQWSEVSGNYAGIFFRVLGGGSAAWEEFQDGAAPRITRMENRNNGEAWTSAVDLPLGWSNWLMTGDHPDWGEVRGTRMHTSNTEVRPVNMAVRLWKRVG